MTLTVDQAELLLVRASYGDDQPEQIEIAQNPGPVDGWGELVYNLEKPQQVGNHTLKLEEEFGGEGQGDQLWAVFSILTGDEKQYFRKSGWYQSHYGSEWDGDLEEVHPVEKTVIVWQ